MNRRLPRAAQQPTRRRSMLTVSAIGAAAVLTLSGCQWTSPITTQKDYDPADGVSANLAGVQLRNILIVAGESGGPGTLVAYGSNPTDQPVTVTFTKDGPPVSLEIPARGAAQLGGTQAVAGGATPQPGSLPNVDAAPGAMTDVAISTPAAGSVQVNVPVVYPHEHSPYATLAPSGFTPRPPATHAPEEDAGGH